jgi:hypothetical protein
MANKVPDNPSNRRGTGTGQASSRTRSVPGPTRRPQPAAGRDRSSGETRVGCESGKNRGRQPAGRWPPAELISADRPAVHAASPGFSRSPSCRGDTRGAPRTRRIVRRVSRALPAAELRRLRLSQALSVSACRYRTSRALSASTQRALTPVGGWLTPLIPAAHRSPHQRISRSRPARGWLLPTTGQAGQALATAMGALGQAVEDVHRHRGIGELRGMTD